MSARIGPVRVIAILTAKLLIIAPPQPAAHGAGYKTCASIVGGSGAQEMEGLRVTFDWSAIVVRYTDSFGDFTSGDAWVARLDQYGNVEWQKTYGGSGEDSLVDVRQSLDGGFIAAGWTKSFGVAKSDMWVVKLSAGGGYIIPGSTVSFSPDYSGHMWIIKLDTAGNIEWQKVFGVPRNWDEVLRAAATADGGLLIGGWVEEGSQYRDLLLLRLDAAGNAIWQKRHEYGWDWPNAIEQTADGRFAVAVVGWPQPADLELWAPRLDPGGTIGTCCPLIRDLTLVEVVTSATPTPTGAIPSADRCDPPSNERDRAGKRSLPKLPLPGPARG